MNELRSRWLIAALPLSMALVFCSSTGGSGGATASASVASAASSTTGAGGAGGHASGSGGDVSFAVGAGGAKMDMPVPLADAGLPPDASVPPPVVACGADAAESCPLPPSYCGDHEWLIFYQNPGCVDGTCHYEAWAKKCGAVEKCINGGCEYNFTI